MQRQQQQKLMDEMFSPITNQILPASIEERIQLYKKRNELEENNINYHIIKEKFLNYRIFSFKLFQGKRQIVEAYPLSYSTLPRKKAQGRVTLFLNNIGYFNREEIIFITLEHCNKLAKTSFKSLKELLFQGLPIDTEMNIRSSILQSPYNLSPIIIVEKIIDTKLTIELDATTYNDTKEKLIIL